MAKLIPLILISIFVAISPHLSAQSLSEFEKHVTEFTLDNGMKFIVLERHEAPVVSFHTYANVGSVNEISGQTGLAHLFEHMAFKGTATLGTLDQAKEQEAMKKEDEAFLRLRAERVKGNLADPAKIEQYTKEFEAAVNAAAEWSDSGQVQDMLERAGAVGLNANTESDATHYYFSLPSNKLELWFAFESDRFLHPVLRDFYKEKNVVMEERRSSVDSNPVGRLLEEFTSAAFKAHPYKEPGLGYMSDLQSISRPEAEAFFKRYYAANNLTMGIVGDVNPGQVKSLAQKYFGRLPAADPPEGIHTIEPEQLGEKRIVVEDRAQPYLIIGYHKTGVTDKDDIVFDVLSDVIGRGRASRLYKNLVKEKQIAVAASGSPGFPGYRYPNLMLFFAVPTPGHSTEECESAMYEEIEKLKAEPVSTDELNKARLRAKADLVRQLGSDSGLATLLPTYEVITGDWRNVFLDLDRLNAVTADDIQRIARDYLIAKHRTVAVMKMPGGK